MERSKMRLDGRIKENSASFLLPFWMDSATCFSRDADKHCVPIDLTFLSALLLLLSSLLGVWQKHKFRGEFSGEDSIVFYCFLGNLCSTVGAILSRQLHIQVFMGAVAAVMDAVHCIMCCLPVFLCWNSTSQMKRRIMRRRRRQHLLAVGVLMVVAGGFLKSRITDPPAVRPVRGRRLLQVLQMSSWSSFMDYNEILGYILGLLSFVIACTSRFPALCRARRGQKLSRASIFSRLLCSLSGAFYTAAILLYATQLEFLMRVMPWLLSATLCVSLDLLILVIAWCKRATRKLPMRFSPDRESLLGDLSVHADDAVVTKQQRKRQKSSSAQTKGKNIQKMTEMGHYMDISVQPVRKQKSLKEVTLSTEGAVDGPLHKMVRVIRLDSLCSSDTSYDSSPVSSDLEVWDFGAAISQWSKPAVKPKEGDEFPLQDWPTNPKPLNICMNLKPEQPQKTIGCK